MSSIRIPQPASDTQHNVRDAALLGASLAFSKPPPTPKPQANTYTGSRNGALVAAVSATPQPLRRDWTGGSFGTRPNASPLQSADRSNSLDTLSIPDNPPNRGTSPSNIAARLAAARYSPSRPLSQPNFTPTTPISSRRYQDERDILPPSGSVGNVLARLEPQKALQPLQRRPDNPTDDTSIPPTTSLVQMFEKNRPPSPLRPSPGSPPPIRSPKPQRVFSMPREPDDSLTLQRKKTLSPPPLKPKPKQQIEQIASRIIDATRDQVTDTLVREPTKSPPIKQKPIRLMRTQTLTPPPKAPPARASRPRSNIQDSPRPTSTRSRPSMSLDSLGSPDSFKSAEEYFELGDEENGTAEKYGPPAPPTRRSQPRRVDTVLAGQSPQSMDPRPQLAPPEPIRVRHQSQVRAPVPPPERFSPPVRPASTTGIPSSSVFHNKYQRQSVQQITQHLTGENLSSAIVGAALASSRNASPAPRAKPVEPLLPPPRKQNRYHSPFHRSPSPPKQSPPKTNKLRTTMRKEPSSSESEDEVDRYKKKGTRVLGIKGRKHPNKHHEGTRRRWRDQITERERKRYEGVWAANKGVFLPSKSSSPVRGIAENDPSLDVLNILVQEIWSRSRLPTHVLEEVWDLVDHKGVGRLNRYEFVVGLWLIDQRLKGRKLPIKVSDSVWDSAKEIGLRVKSIK